MSRLSVALVLAVVALAPAGCGGGQSVPASAIAVVGGLPVPRADFEAQIARSRRAYAAQGKPFPAAGTAAYRHLRVLAVGLVVDRARLEVIAKRHGVTITPAQVAAAVERYRQQSFGADTKRFQEQLRQTGMTEADVSTAIRTQLLAAAVDRAGATGERPKVVYAPGFAPPNGP